MTQMTPAEIVSELDKHIVGQSRAKRAVAIALRNRWRRAQVAEPLRTEITPKNILMIGPTGVGKTEIARRLARLTDAPFVKVEASKFTEVGYVGRDDDSIARALVEAAIRLVKDERRSRVMDRAAAAAYATAELLPGDPFGVGPEVRPVWVEHGAREAALVAHHQRAAVGEGDSQAVPGGVAQRLGVAGALPGDAAPARHPQVEPQLGAFAAVGLQPERLTDAPGAGDRPAGQGVVELAGGVRAADVAVGVVDRLDDPAARLLLDEGPGLLDFRQLRHSPKPTGQVARGAQWSAMLPAP